MNDSFILLNKIKDLNIYTEKYIFTSFPKKELALKIRLETYLYLLVENTIKANVNVGNIKNKYQKEIIISIYLADYYIDIMKEKDLITDKKFQIFVNKLLEIKKIVASLMRNVNET